MRMSLTFATQDSTDSAYFGTGGIQCRAGNRFSTVATNLSLPTSHSDGCPFYPSFPLATILWEEKKTGEAYQSRRDLEDTE